MRTLYRALLCFAFIVSATAPGGAADPSPVPAASPQPTASASPASPIEFARGRLDAMLRTGHADPAWFSAMFLAQVPASRVDDIIAQLKATLGAYRSVTFAGTKFTAHFEKGIDDVLIHLDADMKIDGLLFKPPATASLDDGLRALAAFPGTLSYVITSEGRSDRAALNASQPLAVGSAFKLAVLSAVRDQVALGKRHWNDVIPLDPAWKSLPSGAFQDWPDRTPITLASYAAQMISISDNTAADALVRLAGPKALAPYAGANTPFLTTREMFTLKSQSGSSLRAAYLAATTPRGRAAVLARVDAMPRPAIADLDSQPEPAVEWHYSVRTLCTLLAGVSSLPYVSINPGLADRSLFRRVAYKGGSDVGVVNLTTLVTTKRGTTECFSATLNNAERAIDEQAFEIAYASVVRFLADD
jgi:beta-lactamase class A